MASKKAKKRSSVKKSPKRKKHGVYKYIALGCLFLVVVYLLWLPDVTSLQNANPKTTALIETRKIENKKNEALVKKLQWVPLAEISPSLQRAVITIEDASFYYHDGVDWEQARIVFTDSIRQFKLPRGASTITQQLAKNLYLSESYNPLRKIKEIIIAKRLEHVLTKKRILELYLNLIEWGDDIYGIGAASQYYFHVNPGALSPVQSATLAAIIPNARTVFNPKLHPERVEHRMRLILKRMQFQ